MQIIAVICLDEKDFVRSMFGKETILSKGGGVLVNEFFYKPITHEMQLKGINLNGVMITEKAEQYERLRILFSETFKYIRF